MKFLLDANIPYSAREIFAEKYQVWHVRDVELERAADAEIITWAKRHKAILITRDLDFANILRFPPRHYAGIVVLRVPHFYSAEDIKKILRKFLSTVELKSLSRAIAIVEENRVRLRK